MSKPDTYRVLPGPLVSERALRGLATAVILGTDGDYALDGCREERQYEAERRIRRACANRDASQFETESVIFSFRDLLS